MIKKKGDYLDCQTCQYHTYLYDRHKRITGRWCVQRNGKLKKRFRGSCQFIKGGDAE